MKEDQLFYVGQKAFIEKDGKVLVLTDPEEGLDFPGGKIQEGEDSLFDSLKREAREETGLEIEIGNAFTTWHNTFPESHRLRGKKVFLVGYKCKYISGKVVLSNEHNAFRWVGKNDYREVDDGTAYFRILEEYFRQNA